MLPYGSQTGAASSAVDQALISECRCGLEAAIALHRYMLCGSTTAIWQPYFTILTSPLLMINHLCVCVHVCVCLSDGDNKIEMADLSRRLALGPVSSCD